MGGQPVPPAGHGLELYPALYDSVRALDGHHLLHRPPRRRRLAPGLFVFLPGHHSGRGTEVLRTPHERCRARGAGEEKEGKGSLEWTQKKTHEKSTLTCIWFGFD